MFNCIKTYNRKNCKMIKQVFKSLPDNKPISGLCILEDVTKCPKGYIPVSYLRIISVLFVIA